MMSNSQSDQPPSSSEQSLGTDPKFALKRNSGLFAFFKWFKSGSRESFNDGSTSRSSNSSSLDSLASNKSVGTVASFAFIQPSAYEDNLLHENKCLQIGPETDTYKARLKQRDKRRETDKNISLGKKYNLFFHQAGESLLKSKKIVIEEQIVDENSKSLPLMTRTSVMNTGGQQAHRRTNSESSKEKKAGAYVHVKGKRKAPPPPELPNNLTQSDNIQISSSSSSSTLNSKKSKKSKAPIPPPSVVKSNDNDDKKKNLANDYLKLEHGVLKPVKEETLMNVNNDNKKTIESTSNFALNHSTSKTSFADPPVSPKPWYKRSSGPKDILNKKENKNEPVERLPEIQYIRNSTLDLTIEDCLQKNNMEIEKKKEEKRKSGISFLTSISELDREVTEILQKTKATTTTTPLFELEKNNVNLTEFQEAKQSSKLNNNNNNNNNNDHLVLPKRRSARDLIAKFNAITNATKVTVFGAASQKDKYFGKQNSLDETKQRQVQLLEDHKKRIDEIDKKKDEIKFPVALMKSESATSAIKFTNSNVDAASKKKLNRKNWKCAKCHTDNEYWRIICHNCSTIKPYFDDFTLTSSSSNDENRIRIKSNGSTATEVRIFERSKTQIGFSAFPNNNNNNNNNNNKTENTGEIKTKYASVVQDGTNNNNNNKKEEREKLRKMLIEMKNSLPKRKSDVSSVKPTSRTSVIMENPEESCISSKADNTPSTINKEQLNNSNSTTSKTQEAKIKEILIGSTQTIYENIKIKKTDAAAAAESRKQPLKVSSAAQTNAILRKLTPQLSIKNLIEQHKANNSYEPMQLQDFENIYSSKNENSPVNFYANFAQNDELSLFFNLPKIKENSSSSTPSSSTKITTNNNNNNNNNMATVEINRLLRRLETAIGKGDMTEAAIFAKELAQLKVNCSVIRQKSDKIGPNVSILGGDDEKKRFQIEMYVEDKVSHRGPFPIDVTAEQSVAELKRQISEEFDIPVEVQRWILGKNLVNDDNSTLKDHKIIEGCSVFLYLVSPENRQQSNNDTKQSKETPTTSRKTYAPLSPKADDDDDTFIDSLVVPSGTGIYSDDRKKIEEFNAPKIINLIPKFSDDPLHFPEDINKITKTKCNANSNIFPIHASSNNSYKSTDTELIRAKVSKIELFESPPIVNIKKMNSNDDCAKKKIENDHVQSIVEPKAKEYPHDYKLEQAEEWQCHLCTLLNPLSSNICAVCATIRRIENKKNTPDKLNNNATKTASTKKPIRKNDTYFQLVNLDNEDLVRNVEQFQCIICFIDIGPNQGITLRECLHQFCQECLARTIEYADDAEIKCPYRDNDYPCNIPLQDREIKALVTQEVYEQHLAKSVAQAENQMEKTFHCKTPDCNGWCIFEDNINEFKCPVCKKTNCLTCQTIHTDLNCKQYQERMQYESKTDEEGKRTIDFLQEMVEKGEAIACPTCKVILMKKWGCDWLRCSMCKTEICWVTRGPRWGPGGKGDTSGGCQCGVNGVKCHPKCNYCH